MMNSIIYRHRAFFIGLLLIVDIQGCTYFTLNNAERFYNIFYKFSILIPKDWKKVEEQMGTIVAAISPIDSANDSFRENFNVTVGELPKNVKLMQFYKMNTQQLAETATNFFLHGNGEETIAGAKAYWIQYSHELDKYHFETLLYMFSLNNFVYIVTCTGEKHKFYRYERTFRLIARSFRFEK